MMADGQRSTEMPRKLRKPDPVKICARKHKGWAFMGTMTIEEYRQAEEAVQNDLEILPLEAFTAKYKQWMY